MQITNRSDGSSRITTRRRLELTGAHAAAPIHKRRRKSLVALSLVGLMFAGTAAAYFLAEGSGTGTAHVTDAAPSSNVTVTVSDMTPVENATGGAAIPLTPVSSPGATTEQDAVFGLSVPTSARISHLTASVTADGSGNIIDQGTGNPVPGCLASWFVLDAPPGLFISNVVTALPAMVTPTSNAVAKQAVYLLDSGGDQSACEGVSPEITLTVS